MAHTQLRMVDKEKLNPLTEFREYVDFDATSKKSSVAVNESFLERNEKAPPSGEERLRDARALVTEILLVEDDASLSPWTFRMWFLGIGMSVFAGYVKHKVNQASFAIHRLIVCLHDTGPSRLSILSSLSLYISILFLLPSLHTFSEILWRRFSLQGDDLAKF
jgi:hypothetical protein